MSASDRRGQAWALAAYRASGVAERTDLDVTVHERLLLRLLADGGRGFVDEDALGVLRGKQWACSWAQERARRARAVVLELRDTGASTAR